MKITTKVGKGESASAPVTIDYDMPDSLDEMVKTFGDDVVKAHAQSSIVISLQSFIRTRMKKALDENKTPDPKEIAKDVSEWKPGTRTPGRSKLDRIKEDAGKMSPEERAELLKVLREQTGGKAA